MIVSATSSSISILDIVRDLINDRMALGVFDQSGNIVAMSLANDITLKYAAGPSSPELNRVYHFLDQLSDEYKYNSGFKKGEGYYCFLIGVSNEHRGHKLANLILAEQALLGVELGYKIYYTEATNLYT